MSKRIDLIFTQEMRKKIAENNIELSYDGMLTNFRYKGEIMRFTFGDSDDGFPHIIIFRDEDQKAKFIMRYL